MKKSLVALLIALVVVCLAATALAWSELEVWDTNATEVLFHGGKFNVVKATAQPKAGDCALIVEPTCAKEGKVRFYVATPLEAAAATGETKDVEGKVIYFYDIYTAKSNNHKVVGAYGSATCKTAGTLSGTCSVCGETVHTYGVLNPDKHEDAGFYTKIPVVVAKDCSETSSYVQLCSACGTRAVSFEKGAHKFQVIGLVEGAEPACGATVNAIVKCMVKDCYEGNPEHTEKITLPGHAWGEADITKKPSCIEEGKATWTCENVKIKEKITKAVVVAGVTVSEEIVAYAGQIMTKAEAKALGIAAEKYEVLGCTKDQKLAKVDHKMTKDVIALTDTSKDLGVDKIYACAYTAKACEVCGYVNKAAMTEVPHNYGAWKEQYPATEDHPGYWIAICTNTYKIDGKDVKCGHHLDAISYKAPIDANVYAKTEKKVPAAKPTVSVVKKAGKIVVSAKLNVMAADKVVITVCDAEGNVVAAKETAPKTKVTFELAKGTYKVAVKACVGAKASKTVVKSVKVK